MYEHGWLLIEPRSYLWQQSLIDGWLIEDDDADDDAESDGESLALVVFDVTEQTLCRGCENLLTLEIDRL